MAVELTAAIEAVQAVAGAAEGISDFVAGPTPTNPALAGIQSAARKGCDNLSASPARNLLKLGSGGANGMATLCGAYWDGQGYDAPVTEPPFLGGQCPGQLYSFTATATSVNNLGQTNNATVTLGSTNRISGPVTFVGVEETAQDFIVRARNAAGSIRTFRFLSSGTDAIYSKPTTQSVTLSNIVVSPTDGCGNPSPETGPGLNPAPDNGEAADFDVDIDNNVILPDEVISTPFGDFLLSELVEGILGTLTKGDGSDIDPRLLGNGEPALGAAQDQNGSQGNGGGDEDFGEPPEGRIWVGGVVQIVGGDEYYGNIAASGPENTVYPRVVGNVSLKLENDNSGIIRGTAEQIRSGWTSVFLPSPGLKVTGMRVSVSPEIRYVVYPVSVIDKDALSNPQET